MKARFASDLFFNDIFVFSFLLSITAGASVALLAGLVFTAGFGVLFLCMLSVF